MSWASIGTSKYRLAGSGSAPYSRTMTSSIRLFRVIMPVTDIEQAARFYSALLDQPGLRVSDGRHYFECGGVILAVYDARADGDPAPVRGLSTEMGDGNLPMGRVARRPWGERSFYMHD